MEFERARRNLELANNGQGVIFDQDVDEKSVIYKAGDGQKVHIERDIGNETQVPNFLGFSSISSVPDSEEDAPVFINTQIQSRLDDFEREGELKSRLEQFKYALESVPSLIERADEITSRKSTRTITKIGKKKKIPSGTDPVGKQSPKKCNTKSEQLLKQLSGKHRKIKDIIKKVRQSAAKTKGKKKQSAPTFDIYNAEEWKQTYRRLTDAFPHTEREEILEVYNYLYGGGSETDLWMSSQMPPKAFQEHISTPSASLPRESQQVTVMSLSQVMSDEFIENSQDQGITGMEQQNTSCSHSSPSIYEAKEFSQIDEEVKDNVIKIDLEKQDNSKEQMDLEEQTGLEEQEDRISVVSDSTDDSITAIPLQLEIEEERSSKFMTTVLAPPSKDGIIDLTRSFKAVHCLISPLKPNESSSVQVPATRTSTTLDAPNSRTTKKGKSSKLIKLRILKSQLPYAQESLPGLFRIQTIDTQVHIPATDIEDTDIDKYCVISLDPCEACNKDDIMVSQLASQSATKLRKSLRDIGLKPSRSKSEMVESLQAASQNLDSSTDAHNQRKEIHSLLTTLVQSSPSLHEKVYTFQPLFLEDLVKQLTAANPFIDHINEPVIREWADLQGICLRSS